MIMSGSNHPLLSGKHQYHTHNNQWASSSMHSNSYTDNIKPNTAPMTCSPGSQIVVPNLTEDGTIECNVMVCFHNSSTMAATFSPSVAMHHPSTPP
ncbi:hypothetical protein FS749_000178 [Ceratobasidium sp. UAMH 11750]|nr:hypothetical protein FS749_000178 [Ceratobasidium sp. UAMH 11750]